MHEFGIVQNIVDQAVAAGARHGAKRITTIYLKLGELNEIEPSTLEFLFAGMSRGTTAEGARVETDLVPSSLECRRCGHTFSAPSRVTACPRCGSVDYKVLRGDELIIESLEVE